VDKALITISCQPEVELIASNVLVFQTVFNAAQGTLTNVQFVPMVTLSIKLQIVLHARKFVLVV